MDEIKTVLIQNSCKASPSGLRRELHNLVLVGCFNYDKMCLLSKLIIKFIVISIIQLSLYMKAKPTDRLTNHEISGITKLIAIEHG